MTENRPTTGSYECPKCGHSDHEVGELRGTGGLLGQIFDVQHQRFTTVTCCGCGYTELYRGDASTLEDVLDFFTQ